jgi:hypothetical protein
MAVGPTEKAGDRRLFSGASGGREFTKLEPKFSQSLNGEVVGWIGMKGCELCQVCSVRPEGMSRAARILLVSQEIIDKALKILGLFE